MKTNCIQTFLLAVLLALPLKVTCREDCRGLCVHCGKNLNEEQCSCTTAVVDPRWTALQEIRNQIDSLESQIREE